ncbi:tetraspanin-18-like isoform X1 [Brachionus plicatilis]|uniref:Tetraspanin n=1 Tax=Brachionus plicatilis TaxID=10195 RepID=A0A3M7SM70_BRAPC|nr:tetraspanin-18-like isoform X1 [Brachionus plicatilis]
MAKGGPKLGCGAKLVRFTLVFFNLIFFILGCLILALGIYVLVDPSVKQLQAIANTKEFQKSGIDLTYIDKCGIAFCIFGGFMFLISFLGCCGALKKVKCLLGLYSTILLLILLAEIAIGIFAAVYSSKFKGVITKALKDSIRDQYMGEMFNKTLGSVAWDAVMFNFECCGVYNSSDFNQVNNVWTDRGDALIPISCCKFKDKKIDWSGTLPSNSSFDFNCLKNPTENNSNFGIGCYDKIMGIVNVYSIIVIATAIGIGFILLLGVCFGFYLCKRIRDMDDYI